MSWWPCWQPGLGSKTGNIPLVFDLRSEMEPHFLVSGDGAVTVSSSDLLVMMQFLNSHEELASMTSDLTQGIRISPTGSIPVAHPQAHCHP